MMVGQGGLALQHYCTVIWRLIVSIVFFTYVLRL